MDGTTIRLSDERQRLLAVANDIVSDGPHEEPPTSAVIVSPWSEVVSVRQVIGTAKTSPAYNPTAAISNISPNEAPNVFMNVCVSYMV